MLYHLSYKELYALHLAKHVYETRVKKHVLQLVECVVGPDALHVDLFHKKKLFHNACCRNTKQTLIHAGYEHCDFSDLRDLRALRDSQSDLRNDFRLYRDSRLV